MQPVREHRPSKDKAPAGIASRGFVLVAIQRSPAMKPQMGNCPADGKFGSRLSSQAESPSFASRVPKPTIS